ncbi:MATE family efflux transporter [Mesorhizobium sp. DCY119]|uniref:MATE family efflux transporter n=1 Tax=Mesorhizobium sp. DCY119 TaxID=2108445 RepID=UPI000E6CDBDA|nr:MATE family efflux transporter [Mesorhizobium sp. DCY119]RJG46279.1 MATE family efflux transporter [Mesorhizobium sp. DCY119]
MSESIALQRQDNARFDARTSRLLETPILPLLFSMAWPNVLIMVAQASTGLIETWYVARIGTEALADMALVFPTVMFTTMIAGGALGGGISSSVARALGSGRREAADALVLNAIVVSILLGLAVSLIFLVFGRPIYRLMGGQGAELEAALVYSNVVFSGSVFVWLMNGLASVIRGTGNMLFPALVSCAGIPFLVLISPLLIFGYGPIPALGIAGGGVALVCFYVVSTLAMAWYVLSGRSPVLFRWGRLRSDAIGGILRIGALSSVNALIINVTIGGATALVASVAGVTAVAGFGTGARLEYLLIPIVFGIGTPLVALVATNLGAGQRDRAVAIALTGGALAFSLTEAIGIAAAIWPEAWLRLFSTEPLMIETGSAYLRIVGPVYGFFGLGLSLYFASQGAGRLFWPLVGGSLRIAIALGGGWVALRLTGSLNWLFGAIALGLVAYGLTILTAIRSGAWFR